jgi:hypothetical protein
MANGRDQVVFQFQAYRIVMERREDIDDAAAHAEISRLLGLREPLIAHRDQCFDQGFEIESFGQADFYHRILEHPPRHRPHHQGFDRSHYDGRGLSQQGIERRQLCGLRIWPRRDMGEWSRIRRRQEVNAGVGGVALRGLVHEECQLAGERFRLTCHRCDHKQRLNDRKRRLAHHQGVSCTFKAQDRETALASRTNPRVQLARGFLQTSFHSVVMSLADAPNRCVSVCLRSHAAFSLAIHKLVSANAQSDARARPRTAPFKRRIIAGRRR